jgi:hypothetical protein
MPRMEFEPTTPVFDWAKSVHALDRAPTVIGCYLLFIWFIYLLIFSVPLSSVFIYFLSCSFSSLVLRTLSSHFTVKLYPLVSSAC